MAMALHAAPSDTSNPPSITDHPPHLSLEDTALAASLLTFSLGKDCPFGELSCVEGASPKVIASPSRALLC